MNILIIAEHHLGKLKSSTLHTISAGLKLANQVDVLVAGFQCENSIETLKNTLGVRKILVADDAIYQHPLAESLAPLILEQKNDYSHILAPATTFGKNIMPRVAAQLGVGQISDVIEIKDANHYLRPMYAGNVIAQVKSNDSVQIITVRITAFEAASFGKNDAQVIPIRCKIVNNLSRFIAEELHGEERPELPAAEIVISGGRGLQTKENFSRLIAIADRMHAAIGASRAAVDAGLAPNDFQVGQTGQVVAPKLYIAVGISGAIQHLAGMKDSKIIVAINKDPDAPIFQVADYGLVADIGEVLTQWEQALTAMGR